MTAAGLEQAYPQRPGRREAKEENHGRRADSHGSAAPVRNNSGRPSLAKRNSPRKITKHAEKNHGRKDRQERGPMPVYNRNARPHEPRLVAEPAGHSGAPTQLRSVRSDGQSVRLCQG